MKRFFKTIAALSSALLVAAACQPEVLTPVQGDLPSASDFDVEITVDQATNYVTFTMKNKGMVPMWIFGDEKIDGKANKVYSYTANGLTLRFRDAGEHQVEVKAYNSNGVSQGSKVCTFSLENTYRDPFDASPYMKAIAGEWVWNKDVNGHFGCGSSLDNATDWWSCGANEKADWSLYNDTMTFTEDGKYMFDPGEDGKVYVNKDVTALGGPQEADFLVDIPAYETTYAIENNWNEAGIEEIWLVLPAQKNLSYVPNDNIYNEPRFIFLETKTSQIRKELSLNAAFHGISWHYNFIHPVHQAGPEELLAGTDAAGKVWVMDAATSGHLGCGWDLANAAGWWSCGPNEKDGCGMYDNELTFCPDGTYRFNSGEDGLIYANKCVTALGVTGADADYTATYENRVSTYEFDGTTLKFPAGNTVGYVPSDAMYENPVFTVMEITETRLVLASFAPSVDNPDGIAWQYIFRARDVAAPEVPAEEVDWVAEDSADNLMNGGALALNNFWWANDGWSQIADPDLEMNGNTATITVKENSGGSQWQGQAHFRTGVAIEEGKAYDFRIVLKPSVDLAGATVKPHPTGDDGHFFSEGRHDLAADEDNVITYENFKADFSTEDLVITLDFPGCPAGTVIEVKGIIIQEHRVKSADGASWVAEDSADNLMNGGALALNNFWWANDGWSQIADPDLEMDGNTATITVKETSGGPQWQGQAHFRTGVAIEEGKAYDFRIVLNPSVDLAGATVKPHPTGDDGHFFSEARHDLAADEDNVVSYVNFKADFSTSDLVITLDFPGCPAGTVIEVKGIIIQEHR